MVKLYCDRCKVEIKDKYYEFYVHEHNINSKSSYNAATTANAIANAFSGETVLEELNSRVMFCKECRDKIMRCIRGI